MDVDCYRMIDKMRPFYINYLNTMEIPYDLVVFEINSFCIL